MRKHPWPVFILGSLLIAACGSSDEKKPDGGGTAGTGGGVGTGGSTGGTAGGTGGTSGAAGADASVAADASKDVASQPDGAIADAAADAAAVTDGPPGSMAIGPAGGTLTLVQGKLVIPAGALAQTAFITFRVLNTNFPNIPGNAAPLSGVVSLEPHGQAFAKPVTLTLNHFGGAMPIALYTAQPGGTFTPVANAVLTTTTAEAALDHFSYFVVAPVVAAADAGASPDTATTGPTTRMVKVRGETLSFDPEGVEIKVGDTVTWVWEVGGHSVVSGGKGGTNPADCTVDGTFSSGQRNARETFSFTFTAAGTYGYHCATHCQQFEGGEIVVK